MCEVSGYVADAARRIASGWRIAIYQELDELPIHWHVYNSRRPRRKGNLQLFRSSDLALKYYNAMSRS